MSDTNPNPIRWTALDGQTAAQIEEARTMLRGLLHKTMDDLVDSLAELEARSAEQEMELVAVRRACRSYADMAEAKMPSLACELRRISDPATRVERYTQAHFQVAVQALVGQFLQMNPPNFTRNRVFVEDVDGGLDLEVLVRRDGGRSTEAVLVVKTQEAAQLRAGLEAILDHVGHKAPRGAGQDAYTSQRLSIEAEIRRLAKKALKPVPAEKLERVR